ncbi:MAG TPA: response regulator [Candidatus Paceibacterota bacterium]|nr:response regulator [Candidatus Paceibacterota bacterium]
METSKKILIVEDNEFLGGILTNKLSNLGYTAVLVGDGESGLQKIREWKPDLILLDIVLPKMNGYEVLESCKADVGLRDIPVIVISNSGEPIEIERVLQLGAVDYMIKANFNPDEVLEKVKKALGEMPGEETASEGGMSEGTIENAKILVVEDDEFLRSLMGKKLSQRMHHIFYAVDGKSALEIAGKERPDIILLDLILPGMSGFEVLEQLKQNPELLHIPVIILSNLGDAEKIEKAKNSGAADFLIKANFSIDEIIEKMKAYV